MSQGNCSPRRLGSGTPRTNNGLESYDKHIKDTLTEHKLWQIGTFLRELDNWASLESKIHTVIGNDELQYHFQTCSNKKFVQTRIRSCYRKAKTQECNFIQLTPDLHVFKTKKNDCKSP